MRIAIGGQKGFTLVEIVMVIVILGVIGAFTFQFVAHGVQAFKKSSARKDLYDQGRLALERMVRELRDTKEVTGSAGSSITFKKAHPAQAADNTEEVKFQLNGTNLERVGDPSGTPATAVLASNVSSFTVTGVGVIGGGGLCAITYDSVSTGTASYTTTETFSHTIGSGTNRVLVVGVTVEDCDDYPSVTGITYNGQPLTHIDSGQVISGNGCGGRAELWYLLEANLPSAGPYNVVVSTSGTFDELAAGAISLENVAQQAPEASNSSSNDAQTTISTNITTLTDGAWLVDAVHSGNETGDFVPNGGQTERYQQVSGSSTGAGSTKPIATAGATSAGWTSAGANRLAHAVAAFAPATGCGGGGGGNLVMVTGDGTTTTDADDVIKAALFQSWGWTVTAIDDGATQATYDNAAATNDVMYIAESVGSGNVGTKATNLTIPVVVDEDRNWDEFGFASGGTFYETPGTDITILDNSHYITSPFSTGSLSVYSPATDIGSLDGVANFASGITILATRVADQPSLFVADTGAQLIGLTAPARRVGFYTATGNANNFTSNTETLLQRALDWAAGNEGGSLATLEITLSSAEGGTVSMRTMVYLRNVP